jgi:ABC-type polysaccharide/polyol phosphate export permease
MFGMVITPDDFFWLHVLSVERAQDVPHPAKLVLINPLVYASEGMRATLVPQFPHLCR